MTKQTETIRQLTDRVNALEAMCLDLLATALNSSAQARVKFDDYRFKNTQEAKDKREAEAKAKRLAENYSTAKSDFRDITNSRYWSLVFMSQKQREKALDDIWQSTITGLELPEDAQRPAYNVIEPSEEQLMKRRKELTYSINRANLAHLQETIEHCEQSQLDFTKGQERERDRQIAALRNKDKLTEADRQHQINETAKYYNARIKQHLQEQKRRIDSAKVAMAKREQDEDELKQVNAQLAALLSK